MISRYKGFAKFQRKVDDLDYLRQAQIEFNSRQTTRTL